MDPDRNIRTRMLIGDDEATKLENTRVAVFGAGGVGGYVIEALARCGIGHIDIIDRDVVDVSNINRQILAVTNTIGMKKTEAARQRVLSINPSADVKTYDMFFLPENSDEFDFEEYDYVVDAIDTVTAKIELVMKCQAVDTPLICCMGTGNKMHPEFLQVTDIYKTSVCPLAKVMRKELKARGIRKQKVLFSTELPMKPMEVNGNNLLQGTTSRVPGSISFVPSAAGLIIASVIVREILSIK